MADETKTDETPDEPVAAEDVKKGQLTRTVLHNRESYPVGTKVSDIPDLSADQKSRLTDLGVIKD